MISNKHSHGSFSFKKIISGVTLLCFALTQNTWALPGAGLTIAPQFETPAFLQIEIPSELATIDEIYEAPAQADPKLILHIQNIHGNYESQVQIKKILDYLYKTYGFKLLFAEGAAEKLNPDFLRFFHEPERNEQFADFMARKGELTGVEYYLMNGPKDVEAIGIEQADLYRQNYRAFRKVYAAKAETDSFLESYDGRLELLSSRIFPQNTRRLLSEWKKFEAGHRDFLPYIKRLAVDAKGVLGLDLESLFAQVEWPQITRLLALQSMEKELNKAAAEKEKARLVEFLKTQQAAPAIVAAIEKLDEKRITMERLTPSEKKLEDLPRYLLERLVGEMGPKGFRFHDYPAFSLWAGYLILQNELDSRLLFEEIEKVFTKVLDEMSVTEREKNLLELTRDAILLRKLLNLQLTRKEWERVLYRQEWMKPKTLENRIEKLSQELSGLPLLDAGRGDGETLGRGDTERRRQGEPVIAASPRPRVAASQIYVAVFRTYDTAFNFYELARRRESAFYETMQKEMTARKMEKAVLVTGGFHSDGLMEIFREQQINCGVLMPRIAGAIDTSNYISSMLETTPSILEFKTQTIEAPLREVSLGEQMGIRSLDSVLGIVTLLIDFEGKSYTEEAVKAAAQLVAARQNFEVLGIKKNSEGKFVITLRLKDAKPMTLPLLLPKNVKGGVDAASARPLTQKQNAADSIARTRGVTKPRTEQILTQSKLTVNDVATSPSRSATKPLADRPVTASKMHPSTERPRAETRDLTVSDSEGNFKISWADFGWTIPPQLVANIEESHNIKAEQIGDAINEFYPNYEDLQNNTLAFFSIIPIFDKAFWLALNQKVGSQKLGWFLSEASYSGPLWQSLVQYEDENVQFELEWYGFVKWLIFEYEVQKIADFSQAKVMQHYVEYEMANIIKLISMPTLDINWVKIARDRLLQLGARHKDSLGAGISKYYNEWETYSNSEPGPFEDLLSLKNEKESDARWSGNLNQLLLETRNVVMPKTDFTRKAWHQPLDAIVETARRFNSVFIHFSNTQEDLRQRDSVYRDLPSFMAFEIRLFDTLSEVGFKDWVVEPGPFMSPNIEKLMQYYDLENRPPLNDLITRLIEYLNSSDEISLPTALAFPSAWADKDSEEQMAVRKFWTDLRNIRIKHQAIVHSSPDAGVFTGKVLRLGSGSFLMQKKPDSLYIDHQLSMPDYPLKGYNFRHARNWAAAQIGRTELWGDYQTSAIPGLPLKNQSLHDFIEKWAPGASKTRDFMLLPRSENFRIDPGVLHTDIFVVTSREDKEPQKEGIPEEVEDTSLQGPKMPIVAGPKTRSESRLPQASEQALEDLGGRPRVEGPRAEARAAAWLRGIYQKVANADPKKQSDAVVMSRRRFLKLFGTAAVAAGIQPGPLLQSLPTLAETVAVPNETLPEFLMGYLTPERLELMSGIGNTAARLNKLIEVVAPQSVMEDQVVLFAERFWNVRQRDKTFDFVPNEQEMKRLLAFFNPALVIKNPEEAVRIKNHPVMQQYLKEWPGGFSNIRESLNRAYEAVKEYPALTKLEYAHTVLSGASRSLLDSLYEEGVSILDTDPWFQYRRLHKEILEINDEIEDLISDEGDPKRIESLKETKRHREQELNEIRSSLSEKIENLRKEFDAVTREPLRDEWWQYTQRELLSQELKDLEAKLNRLEPEQAYLTARPEARGTIPVKQLAEKLIPAVRELAPSYGYTVRDTETGITLIPNDVGNDSVSTQYEIGFDQTMLRLTAREIVKGGVEDKLKDRVLLIGDDGAVFQPTQLASRANIPYKENPIRGIEISRDSKTITLYSSTDRNRWQPALPDFIKFDTLRSEVRAVTTRDVHPKLLEEPTSDIVVQQTPQGPVVGIEGGGVSLRIAENSVGDRLLLQDSLPNLVRRLAQSLRNPEQLEAIRKILTGDRLQKIINGIEPPARDDINRQKEGLLEALSQIKLPAWPKDQQPKSEKLLEKAMAMVVGYDAHNKYLPAAEQAGLTAEEIVAIIAGLTFAYMGLTEDQMKTKLKEFVKNILQGDDVHLEELVQDVLHSNQAVQMTPSTAHASVTVVLDSNLGLGVNDYLGDKEGLLESLAAILQPYKNASIRLVILTETGQESEGPFYQKLQMLERQLGGDGSRKRLQLAYASKNNLGTRLSEAKDAVRKSLSADQRDNLNNFYAELHISTDEVRLQDMLDESRVVEKKNRFGIVVDSTTKNIRNYVTATWVAILQPLDLLKQAKDLVTEKLVEEAIGYTRINTKPLNSISGKLETLIQALKKITSAA